VEVASDAVFHSPVFFWPLFSRFFGLQGDFGWMVIVFGHNEMGDRQSGDFPAFVWVVGGGRFCAVVVGLGVSDLWWTRPATVFAGAG